jgi:hypothetical protein
VRPETHVDAGGHSGAGEWGRVLGVNLVHVWPGWQRGTLTVRAKQLDPEERPELREGNGQPLLALLPRFAPVPQHDKKGSLCLVNPLRLLAYQVPK